MSHLLYCMRELVITARAYKEKSTGLTNQLARVLYSFPFAFCVCSFVFATLGDWLS